MRQIAFAVSATLMMTSSVLADAREDSLALLNVLIEASDNLAPAIENWDQTASPALAEKIDQTVLNPIEAATATWFDAGMKEQDEFKPFMVCHDASYELLYQAVELIHFHRGNYAAEKVTFKHVQPAVDLMDQCLAAIK